jgi:O-antigen/teichoic acid export membrane protein
MAETTVVLLRLSFIFAVVAALVMYFLVPYLVPPIFGDDYIPSIRILQLILPGIIMVVIFRILSGHIAGLGKPEIALYIFLPALAINVLLNLLWIPHYGGRGAAMATNVSYTVGSIGYMIAYARIVKIPLLEIITYKKSDFTQIRQLIRGMRK